MAAVILRAVLWAAVAGDVSASVQASCCQGHQARFIWHWHRAPHGSSILACFGLLRLLLATLPSVALSTWAGVWATGQGSVVVSWSSL